MDANLIRKYSLQAKWLQNQADIESVCRVLAERDEARAQVMAVRKLLLVPSDDIPDLAPKQRLAYDALAHGADTTTFAKHIGVSPDYAREIVSSLAAGLKVNGQVGIRVHFATRLYEIVSK